MAYSLLHSSTIVSASLQRRCFKKLTSTSDSAYKVRYLTVLYRIPILGKAEGVVGREVEKAPTAAELKSTGNYPHLGNPMV